MLKVVQTTIEAMYYSFKLLYYSNKIPFQIQYQPILWLCRLLKPVFIGGALVAFPELSVEIGLIVETRPVKDLGHGQLGGGQQVGGMF